MHQLHPNRAPEAVWLSAVLAMDPLAGEAVDKLYISHKIESISQISINKTKTIQIGDRMRAGGCLR